MRISLGEPKKNIKMMKAKSIFLKLKIWMNLISMRAHAHVPRRATIDKYR